MLMTVFTLHENMALWAFDQRVVAGLYRVQVELSASNLSRNVGALAKLVSRFHIVDPSCIVEVTMVFQSSDLHLTRLFHEE